jgi:hypothetical protein
MNANLIAAALCVVAAKLGSLLVIRGAVWFQRHPCYPVPPPQSRVIVFILLALVNIAGYWTGCYLVCARGAYELHRHLQAPDLQPYLHSLMAPIN